ncbi:cell morphogenesis N-terminal-domain-containing protein [Crucibulum laeve]|uniref:Cell morphogenesis N-terminal-domain-containing protein n=1 Tax=Crucibulum laeve TaxID=68775 RepID=A0A5C3M9V9_9AGAR|nr:cell morphogenesis N-terminal-domain-containing protein [Crucibulum laeve]
MSEGIQITIPDFDDDDVRSAPTPFGRSGFGFGSGGGGSGSVGGFGGGFGGFGSGLDSPSLSTPLASAERSYFSSHTRGDSATSVDSASSVTTRFPSKPSTPFAHSSQSSINITGGAFSKKPSFASIRNAFKSGKNNDAPPVPQLDHQPYPVLKNPFNRSTSSLHYAPPLTARTANHSFTNGSTSPYPRPPTPGSNGTGFARSKTKSHAYGKSQHSHSGSIFHTSDGGSDYGHAAYPSSPPPVPRVPNVFGHVQRGETPPLAELEDDKVVMDPKTPSDYALHAIFIRFATSAEGKIDAFLRQPMDQEPLLPDFMGPGVDTKFDEVLQSLGKIAQKHAKPVIDSIMRWRRTQNDNVGSDIIRLHTTQSPGPNRGLRAHDVPGLLNERKSLASIYIMCRALIAVLQSVSKDTLGDMMGYSLEETTFEQFRRPDLKLLTQSANHRTNAELYATLLGHIANVRFISVTDRFLGELGPVALGQVPKDLDMKYENLVKGLKHIQIKVWPPEAFEEGAEFLESLSKSYINAHGLRLKIAFAETLTQILHPIGKTAQAETNNPQWAKAIEIIYPKAKEMMAKPRYWGAAFPLAVTSLCVAPQTYFLKHWVSFFEVALSKFKEKPYRVPVMNGLLRLIWTYMYRCQESASTTTTKLDILLKHFFPSHKLGVFPLDDHLEPFVYIVHFILSRHFEYGRDFCLELMQEAAISSLQKSGNIGSVLAPERTAIAIQAILLSLHAVEREASTPAWPSSNDFSVFPAEGDYPTSADHVPASMMSKPGMQDFFERCGTTLAAIAIFCSHAVGHMSIFDDQWAYSKLNLTFEESHNYVVRQHAHGPTIAYPVHFVPHVAMLQTCFQSWPRCLHPTILVADAIDMLLRGVIHVEPALSDVASAAIKRFMKDASHSLTVVARFTSFLFSPNRIVKENSGIRLFIQLPHLTALWVNVVETWIRSTMKLDAETFAEEEQIVLAKCSDIEAAALFLMTHPTPSIHAAGVKIIRLLGLLVTHISGPITSAPNSKTSLYFTERMHGRGIDQTYLNGYDDLLDKTELARLEQWRQSKRVDVPLRIADSANEKDRNLWRYIFPAFMRMCMDDSESTLGLFRETVIAAAHRYHPSISHLAGLSNRMPAGLASRNTGSERDGLKMVRDNKSLIDQWHIWVKVLCSTAFPPDVARPAFGLGREHSRAPSDTNFERERFSTTRGLFRYLTPFLDSEYTMFRDAAVLCISSFPASSYPQLLEDLSLLAGRQFYDDPRSKIGVPPNLEQSMGLIAGARQPYDEPRSKLGIDRSRRQERLHSAVARIYFLTANHLQLQRSTGRQAALANVLKFVRNTQVFLSSPEMRENHTLQRLRRYFCGTVERVFDGLAFLKDTDRFIPSKMHLTLYRLCEEWCQLGPQSDAAKRRLDTMQRNAVSSESSMDTIDPLEKFKNETLLLSYAAIGALASLCPKAFSPPDSDHVASSPTEKPPQEFLKPLSAPSVLERFSAILSSSHSTSQARGKKALKSLLTCSTPDHTLLKESLRRAVLVNEDLDTGRGRFCEVIADIVCKESHSFTFSQVICLGLTNLRHPSAAVRSIAFDMIEAIHQQSAGLLAMSNFETTVGSCSSGTYTHAHRLISDFLAGEHPQQATSILAELGDWLPELPDRVLNSNIVLLLLQSLEFWLPNINLMTEDRSTISRHGLSVMYHLMSLTQRYAQSHPEQILVMWTKLVDQPHESNGHATIRFLLEQSHKVGSTAFILCAANIVACLCQTHIGREIFTELCSVIEPARMLPTIDHKLTFPREEDTELWTNLAALFSEQPRLTLSSAQFAWLFMTDVALQRCWEMKEQLPVLLQALFTHLDHRTPFVRQRAQTMLFQLLRSWTPGYDELPDRSSQRARSAVKESITQLEQDAEIEYWKEDEDGADAVPKMKWLCSKVLEYLEPLAPNIRNQWGLLASLWGTQCSIRTTAFRSMQIFRALMPRIKRTEFANIIGRLSNTISASDENIQAFTSEILLTITAIAEVHDVDGPLIAPIFWCACAALSTTVEKEFTQVLNLLESLLEIVDLDNPSTVEFLLSQRPSEWKGNPYIQPALLKGLRSSTTSAETMRILRILAKVQDDRIIDASEGRVRDLYTASLPWCLHAMDNQDTSLAGFAENIAVLALQEGKKSIHKIMNSFAKGHFRTRDDFLRQSVSSLREHYGSQHWTEVVTLLLGLVLNNERWLRVQAMQILKVLFQQRETRNPVELLGSELLMPLLRLLETDLAPQALDVLEEPMAMSGGGPAAKHVLRMSMHIGMLEKSDIDSVATVFGVPEESGWCIAQADMLREYCQANVEAVFNTCNSRPSRPSRINFEPEAEVLASIVTPEEDLGGLVKNLHELTSYFQEGQPSKLKPSITIPDRRLEARVAAILAKSTASSGAITDTPQTPFLDVFHVGGTDVSDDSDEYSDSDSDLDAFVFDSRSTYRNAPNGARYH